MSEELKEFWEWCGWNWQTEKESLVGHRATVKYIDPPPVNLDNLFKWAVPKLGFIEIRILYDAEDLNYYAQILTPLGKIRGESASWNVQVGEALHEAIQEVRKQGQEEVG